MFCLQNPQQQNPIQGPQQPQAVGGPGTLLLGAVLLPHVSTPLASHPPTHGGRCYDWLHFTDR